MSGVRPFRLPTRSELGFVEAEVRAALDEWNARWLPAQKGLGVACSIGAQPQAAGAETEGCESGWLYCRGDVNDVWVRDDAVAMLSEQLFGSKSNGAVAEAVARSSIDELLARVAGRAGIDASPSVEGVRGFDTIQSGKPGQALFSAALSWGDEGCDRSIELVIERRASHVPAVATSDLASIASVRHAVRAQPLQIEIRLGEVEVELGVLKTLAVGDVLKLDRPLDAGAEVRIYGHCTPCVAYLGTSQGRMAVALANR